MPNNNPHSPNRIDRDTSDHKYFVIIQRFVWAHCRDPFDYTLWGVVKDIAGDTGECILSTPHLAALAMMSVGRVSGSRAFLLEAGLLLGERKIDPGYPQKVWHLAIPDLWQRNIEWSLQHPTIADRVAFKLAQKKHLSCGEGQDHLSPHEKGVPPHESRLSPHEKGVPPHERKKKELKSPKSLEEVEGVLTQNDIRKKAEETFTGITHLQAIGNAKELGVRWYQPLREICKLCEWNPALIEEVIAGGIKKMQTKKLDILTPQSILGYCNVFYAEKKGNQPHGANGSSLTPPINLPADLLAVWKTAPLDLQKYLVRNPTKTANFKAALISKGLY